MSKPKIKTGKLRILMAATQKAQKALNEMQAQIDAESSDLEDLLKEEDLSWVRIGPQTRPGSRPPAYQVEPDPVEDVPDAASNIGTDLDMLEPIELPSMEAGFEDELAAIVSTLEDIAYRVRRLTGQAETERDGLPPGHDELEKLAHIYREQVELTPLVLGHYKRQVRELALTQRFMSYLVQALSEGLLDAQDTRKRR